MSRKILFVLRDGALLEPPDGNTAASSFPIPVAQVFGALQRFLDAGYALVAIGDDEPRPADRQPDTNAGTTPPGIARDALARRLFESQNIAFENWLACPHVPRDACDCRLPSVGLFRDYLRDPALDRGRSAIVTADEAGLVLAANMGLEAVRLEPSAGWRDVAHTLLDAPRTSRVDRRTRETDITVEVDLDRKAEPEITTGIGFFDHMLEQLGKHGAFALRVTCRGDLEVDEHHTVEDVGLALGEALSTALGDKRGIGRYGFVLPMDEADAQVALDLSGRPYFVFEGSFPREQIGTLPTELVPHFFRSLSDALGATMHVRVRGENTHHMIEACFKGLARTMRQAFARAGDELPTTKGTL